MNNVSYIKELVNGYKKSYMIISALEVGLFDVLNKNYKSIYEIATELKVNVDKIRPLLNALVYFNLVEKDNDNYYLDKYYNELSSFSDSNQLGYIKHAHEMLLKWDTMVSSIKNDNVSTNNFNELINSNDSITESFIKAMNTNALPQAKYLINNYNFDNHYILDIGAGAGTYSISVGNKYLNSKGILFDLPKVAEIIKNNIKAVELQNRFKVDEGNYNEQIPNGEFDDIFLFAVAHIESQQNLKELLKKIYNNLKPNGRLFLTSFFLNNDMISPEFSVMFGLEMLVMSSNGKVYSHNEIKCIMKEVGFKNIEIKEDIPSPATLYVVSK